MLKKGCYTVVVFLALFFYQIIPASAFSELYIFGDSLEDTGNLASFGESPFPPPYFENRITHGPVAVDVLAEGDS